MAKSFTSYYTEGFVNLCKCVNSSSCGPDEMQHILKGINDVAFQMLFARNVLTVAKVISLCQSYDKLNKQDGLISHPP